MIGCCTPCVWTPYTVSCIRLRDLYNCSCFLRNVLVRVRHAFSNACGNAQKRTEMRQKAQQNALKCVKKTQCVSQNHVSWKYGWPWFLLCGDKERCENHNSYIMR